MILVEAFVVLAELHQQLVQEVLVGVDEVEVIWRVLLVGIARILLPQADRRLHDRWMVSEIELTNCLMVGFCKELLRVLLPGVLHLGCLYQVAVFVSACLIWEILLHAFLRTLASLSGLLRIVGLRYLQCPLLAFDLLDEVRFNQLLALDEGLEERLAFLSQEQQH